MTSYDVAVNTCLIVLSVFNLWLLHDNVAHECRLTWNVSTSILRYMSRFPIFPESGIDQFLNVLFSCSQLSQTFPTMIKSDDMICANTARCSWCFNAYNKQVWSLHLLIFLPIDINGIYVATLKLWGKKKTLKNFKHVYRSECYPLLSFNLLKRQLASGHPN